VQHHPTPSLLACNVVLAPSNHASDKHACQVAYNDNASSTSILSELVFTAEADTVYYVYLLSSSSYKSSDSCGKVDLHFSAKLTGKSLHSVHYSVHSVPSLQVNAYIQYIQCRAYRYMCTFSTFSTFSAEPTGKRLYSVQSVPSLQVNVYSNHYAPSSAPVLLHQGLSSCLLMVEWCFVCGCLGLCMDTCLVLRTTVTSCTPPAAFVGACSNSDIVAVDNDDAAILADIDFCNATSSSTYSGSSSELSDAFSGPDHTVFIEPTAYARSILVLSEAASSDGSTFE